MGATIHTPEFTRISGAEIEMWHNTPTAVISDELNRTGAMQPALRPLKDGSGFAAQALTVQCTAGDNAVIHYALSVAWPGCALVIDGRGHVDTALWGGILTAAALARGVVAVIIDGAVRDAAELRDSELVVYCREIIPHGPRKGSGGAVNVAIQCGGASVQPGDLVVGDDDGIVVIAPDKLPGLRRRCDARIAKETEWLERIAGGVSTVELLGLPPPERTGS